ncbi:hypothetical protein HMPREF9446_00908 [Bacteroides fluxus YIT 12057]|uniref:Uncharacterized protein n=1 Tax=Bacteroides fluxus YIT 12057 TaxID=763034 RepID=F3PQB5_9BACE|nr:hypothetical protein HMPREF9446_00908 [Bacteroides fluxus YIT 12057]
MYIVLPLWFVFLRKGNKGKTCFCITMYYLCSIIKYKNNMIWKQ